MKFLAVPGSVAALLESCRGFHDMVASTEDHVGFRITGPAYAFIAHLSIGDPVKRYRSTDGRAVLGDMDRLTAAAGDHKAESGKR